MVKCRCAGTTQSERRLNTMTPFNPVFNHYIYLTKQKFNGFVVNKVIEDILRRSVLKARNILYIHTVLPTYPSGSWKVEYFDTKYLYEVNRSYFKFACSLSLWGICNFFVSINVPSCYKIPIILQKKEFCKTYYGTE